MKKPIMIVTVVSVLIMSFAATGLVFAQEGVPPRDGHDGVLREYMHAALAAELGMSVEELEASIAAGEKLHDIAEALGLDQEAFVSMVETASQNALDAALADAVITQQEYDAILKRGFRGPGGQGPAGRMRIADLLGLRKEELKARLDAGETLSEIAEDLGVELPPRPQGHGRNPERLAEVLGISVEELQQRLDDGQTVQEIAEDVGVELPQRPERRGPGSHFGPGGPSNNDYPGSGNTLGT